MNNTCPWCKSIPSVKITPLWNGSRGYYGCHKITVGCRNSECPLKPETRQYNTVAYGSSIEEQTEKAWKDWNKAFCE